MKALKSLLTLCLASLLCPIFPESAAALAAEADALAADAPLGSGPFKAIMVAEPSLPTHTIYRPQVFPEHASLPVVAWGNGACLNAGNRFRAFLTEIASYGYVVIAIGPIVAEGATTSVPAAPRVPAGGVNPDGSQPKLPPPASHSSQLLDAIDWAQAQNARGDSPYYHRLDVSRVALMGQSCGGVQTIEASADPRVKTSVIWNSGLFPGTTDMAGGEPLTKDALKRLHAPTAYISGDAQDIAHANADDDYARISHIPVLRAWERGIGHGGTYRESNGGEFAGVAVAWLDWQLKADARAARLFLGPNCGLCANPRWVVAQKGFR